MRCSAPLFAALLAAAAGTARAAEVSPVTLPSPPAATPSTSPASPGPSASTGPEAAKKAVDDHVQAKTRDGQGVYRLTDDETGQTLELVYEHTSIVAAGAVWSAHDGARIAGRTDFYACSTFHPAHGPADRRYDLDFRVEPRASGYVVREVVIHRDGKRVGDGWVWTARPAPKPHELGTGAAR